MLPENADALATGFTPPRPDSPPPKRSTRGRPWQQVFAVIGIIAALVSNRADHSRAVWHPLLRAFGSAVREIRPYS